MFDFEEFAISPAWDGGLVMVDHFEVAEEHRGEGVGSAVLETMKQVYAFEGAEVLRVRMGGGEIAESFLEANGFEVIRVSEAEFAEGGYVVTGEFVFE